jgi:hypothetical protein
MPTWLRVWFAILGAWFLMAAIRGKAGEFRWGRGGKGPVMPSVAWQGLVWRVWHCLLGGRDFLELANLSDIGRQHNNRFRIPVQESCVGAEYWVGDNSSRLGGQESSNGKKSLANS